MMLIFCWGGGVHGYLINYILGQGVLKKKSDLHIQQM